MMSRLMPYRSRVLGMVIGAFISILLLTLGLGPTLIISLFLFGGFLIGSCLDRGIKLESLLSFRPHKK